MAKGVRVLFNTARRILETAMTALPQLEVVGSIHWTNSRGLLGETLFLPLFVWFALNLLLSHAGHVSGTIGGYEKAVTSRRGRKVGNELSSKQRRLRCTD